MGVADAPGPAGRTIRIDDGVLAPHREALAALDRVEPVRAVFAAAHLVMAPSYESVRHSPAAPGPPAELAPHVDWNATMSIRRWLAGLGFGIAEAMDTAQRFEIGWNTAAHLIRSTGELQLGHGFIAGAGADHARDGTRSAMIDSVVEQARFIQAAGGIAILLPVAALAEDREPPDGYVAFYRDVVDQLEGPLLVHWLGEMFAPRLRGYFPGDSFARVMAIDPHKIRGCKLSLLDASRERAIRRDLLTRRQFVMTGDDFHFARLILGGDTEHDPDRVPAPRTIDSLAGRPLPLGDFSHALLGVLDGIARPASVALRFLAHGDADRYLRLMAPCERLGRAVFERPTAHYKAGLAFLSWLNGRQDRLLLANHAEQSRTTEHYLRVAELAAQAGAIDDAKLAAERLTGLVGSLRG
jgi:hypothetical protein